MQKVKKPPLARATTDFVFNVPVICEEAEQVVFDGGSMIYLNLWEKNIRCQDAGIEYTNYVISNLRSASVVFDSYPETLKTTANTHKCCLICYFNVKRMHFQEILPINMA